STLIGLCAIVFGPISSAWLANVPRSSLIILPMLAAALRFGQRGATASILLASLMAIIGTANHFGPFARDNISEGLLSLQLVMGIVSTTVLIVGAAVEERMEAEEILRQSETRLEEKVFQRTAELE